MMCAEPWTDDVRQDQLDSQNYDASCESRPAGRNYLADVAGRKHSFRSESRSCLIVPPLKGVQHHWVSSTRTRLVNCQIIRGALTCEFASASSLRRLDKRPSRVQPAITSELKRAVRFRSGRSAPTLPRYWRSSPYRRDRAGQERRRPHESRIAQRRSCAIREDASSGSPGCCREQDNHDGPRKGALESLRRHHCVFKSHSQPQSRMYRRGNRGRQLFPRICKSRWVCEGLGSAPV